VIRILWEDHLLVVQVRDITRSDIVATHRKIEYAHIMNAFYAMRDIGDEHILGGRDVDAMMAGPRRLA